MLVFLCFGGCGADSTYSATKGYSYGAAFSWIYTVVIIVILLLVFLLRAYSTRGLLEIDFHPAWLLMNLALVLAEIYLLISWEHWVIPVTLLVVLIIAVNIREVWSMLQKLLSKFKRTK